jgi:hypothetical protein
MLVALVALCNVSSTAAFDLNRAVPDAVCVCDEHGGGDGSTRIVCDEVHSERDSI